MLKKMSTISINNNSLHSGITTEDTETCNDLGAPRLPKEKAAQGRQPLARTCEQEAGDRHGVQLLGGDDVIAVQEVVQQVDGQVPGRRAELAVAAQQGQGVHKEPAALQEWGVGSEGGQLQFLKQEGKKAGQGCLLRASDAPGKEEVGALTLAGWGHRFPLYPVHSPSRLRTAAPLFQTFHPASLSASL